MAFHEMGLDDRILKSIAKLGWSVPTLIQVKLKVSVIPSFFDVSTSQTFIRNLDFVFKTFERLWFSVDDKNLFIQPLEQNTYKEHILILS